MTEKKERELEMEYSDDITGDDIDNIQTPLNLAVSRIASRRVKSGISSKVISVEKMKEED